MNVVSLRRADGSGACDRCYVADTLWTRTRGLLGRAELGAGEGLLLRRTGSVHTLFMRFSIDVVFLDGELSVLSVRPRVLPWRFVGQRGAKATLELPAGAADLAGITPGTQLQVTDCY
jgi:uncharacterized membrane protein (UPF0127 family)